MIGDSYKFTSTRSSWDDITFEVTPTLEALDKDKLNVDVWKVTKAITIHYDSGRKKTIKVYSDDDPKETFEIFKKKLTPIVRKINVYALTEEHWKAFNQAFDDARRHYVTKQLNAGNVTLNRNREYTGDFRPEPETVEANRSRIRIECPITILLSGHFEIQTKILVEYKLAGKRSWGTGGCISDIANSALFYWIVNDEIVCYSDCSTGKDTPKLIETCDAVRAAFDGLSNVLPDFGMDTFNKILTRIKGRFWSALAKVNWWNYHISQVCQTTGKDCEFDVEFGFGGHIYFNFNTGAYCRNCDVVLYNLTSNVNRFDQNLHFDTTDSKQLLAKKDVEKLVGEFFNLAKYKPEDNLGHCELDYISYIVADIEKYWKENLQQPFLDDVFPPEVVKVNVNVKLEPAVETVNLTFNNVRDIVKEVNALRIIYINHYRDKEREQAHNIFNSISDIVDSASKEELEKLSDWCKKLTLENDYGTFKHRFEAIVDYALGNFKRAEEHKKSLRDSDLYKKLDYYQYRWHNKVAEHNLAMSQIVALIIKSNDSRESRDIVSEWLSTLDVNTVFYNNVQNAYDEATYIGARKNGIVRSGLLEERLDSILGTYANQKLRTQNFEYWKTLLEKKEKDWKNTIKDICNPIEYGPTLKYYTELLECRKKEIDKLDFAMLENRPALSDDWIRHQFNELDRRLKDVEGQTKGVNKSCSKLHKAFEDLKKEMVELYHGRESEFKLIEETIEKLERKVFPEIYARNPFEHWKLNISVKRPTCEGCADDMNVGDCTNCWKCKDGSEYRPFDGKKTWAKLP